MEDKISNKVKSIPRSGIRDFFELVQGRDDVISLGVGEPDFCSPWHIREAVIYSLEKGLTSYTSNLGLLSLRTSISKYVDEFFKIKYDPKTEILITVGVSEALDLICRALINPGDEFIYHEPSYVSYNPSITLAYGVPVPIETKSKEGFILRSKDVEEKITNKTKILLLNFPTNPTGAIEPLEELEKIAHLAIKHDIIVITDEIYSEITYDNKSIMEAGKHTSIASLPGMKERTILLHGFSKAFAMTGFRLGYSCAPKVFTEAMMKIHQYSMLCAPIMSQYAAIEALENGMDEKEKMRIEYAKRRNFVLKKFHEMGLICFEPKGTFYMFLDIRKYGLSSKEFAIELLNQKNVAVVPGDAFGAAGEGFIRVCYATSFYNLEIALKKIESFLKRK